MSEIFYFFRRMCSGTGFLGLVGGNMCTTADGIARWTHFILILASAFILTRTWIQNSFINWHFTTSRHWESWSQSRSQSWRQRIRIWSCSNEIIVNIVTVLCIFSLSFSFFFSSDSWVKTEEISWINWLTDLFFRAWIDDEMLPGLLSGLSFWTLAPKV